MNWEGITAIVACGGLLFTIVGFAVTIGKLVARFEVLENRVCEDRDHNSDQHKEFYTTVRSVEGLQVSLTALGKNVDEVKAAVVEIHTLLLRRP